MKVLYTLFVILSLVSLLSAQTPADDKVENMPLYGDVSYDIYSGMLDVTESGSRQIHYFFLEAVNDPANAPIVIWLNGGPGCSSLLGLIQENGPFLFTGINTFLSDFQEYSWNNNANMLYLEGPPGVGFSINNDPDYVYNDENTAADFLSALIAFRERFEGVVNFKNPLWLSGESYAGMYVPFFTKAILDYNNDNQSTAFNAKGFLVGNNCMLMGDDEAALNLSSVMQYVDNNFVNIELRDYFYNDCLNDIESKNCLTFIDTFVNVANNTDPYSIYNYTYSYSGSPFKQSNKEQEVLLDYISSKSPLLSKIRTEQKKVESQKTCGNSNKSTLTPDGIIDAYFNLPEVKEALHVNPDTIWTECSGKVGNQYQGADNSSSLYRQFVEAGLNILTYSGNDDAIVPWEYTYWCLDDVQTNPEYGISIEKTQKWRQWKQKQNDQVGGMVQYWSTETDSQFVYAMVRAAGHEVPEYQPAAAYYMFNQFINGEDI